MNKKYLISSYELFIEDREHIRHTNFLLNIRIREIFCNLYIHSQIGIQFYQSCLIIANEISKCLTQHIQ